MANLRKLISISCFSVSLFYGCSTEEDIIQNQKIEKTSDASISPPDLSQAVEKRIEGKTSEAIEILRKFNSDYPDSQAILLQLARALSESKQFALAAFRFDQAISAGAEDSALREAAEAYVAAGDLYSASERYSDYLVINNEDGQSWVKFGRILSKINKPTEAINAFNKGAETLTFEDCLLMGDLMMSKKLLPQSEYWYKTARNMNTNSPEPLLSLLKIKLQTKDDDVAENLIFEVEEISSGTLDRTDLAQPSANLLRKRNLGEFIRKGIAPSTLTVEKLVKSLNDTDSPSDQNVISAGPKLPLVLRSMPSDVSDNELETRDPEESEESSAIGMNLADAFSRPPEENFAPPAKSNIEIARNAYLERKYQDALFAARSAVKENPKNAEAWKLCSQAHFQIGETREAEMTILEAIRHDPLNFEIRMDYLRIARETLSSNRYLNELEKARELFPESSDIVWELARRYHLVERMPVTAGVLYRKVLELEPSGSPLSLQAEMELLKLRE